MALGTTNISTDLVLSTLLGISHGGFGADVGTLCTHPAINKWSKWKPVKLPQIDGVDETQLKAINYGLTFPRTNVFNVIATQKWTYDKPTGGAASPYRLGDFRQYHHGAVRLVGCPAVTEINIFENPNDTLTFQFPTAVTGQLQMSDFTGILANQYLGIVIVTSGGATYIITSPTTASAGGNQITLDLTAAPFNGVTIGDTFTFYYILSNIQVSPISSNVNAYITNNLFIPIPNNAGDTSYNAVDIINHYQGVFGIDLIYDAVNGTFDTVSGYYGIGDENSPHYITNNGSAYFRVTISNPTSGSISFYRQEMKVKYTTNFWGYERNENLAVYDSSWNAVTTDITIGANSSVTLYMGTASTLFRNGTAANADIISPASGARTNPSIRFLYKNSQVFNFTNFRFQKA